MDFAYPFKLVQEDSEYIVCFPDVPEAITGTDNEGEVTALAHDALIASLREYVECKEPIPSPSSSAGYDHVIYLTPLEAAKLGLYIAKREHNLSNIELADKLGVDEKTVRRMLDLDHATKIGVIESALRNIFNYHLHTSMEKSVEQSQAEPPPSATATVAAPHPTDHQSSTALPARASASACGSSAPGHSGSSRGYTRHRDWHDSSSLAQER
ncbi:MAG: hypothetical protein F6J95_007635 [Leptolyngbya sp. SIO1E4]|nr:hypothetical protein [Leptolyngbya sp. SIO1E4]